MRKFDSSVVLRPELAELKAYSPVAGNFEVRLDANEAPPLLSPAAKKRLADLGANIDYSLYPDAAQKELRKAIAENVGLTPAEVSVGVGSDELISILMTIASRPRSRSGSPTIVTTTPTFVMYRLSARTRGERVMEVPLDDQWDIDAEGLLRAVQFAEPNLIFIATPNNPTGTMATESRLLELIEAAKDSIIVIDEAYINYAARNHLALLKKYENVVILRTLSKIGFAGLRVGWLIGSKTIIAEVDKARLPYNITTHSQKLATAVLTELTSEIAHITGYVKAERARVSEELGRFRGVQVVPSEANFLWLELERPAEEVFGALAKEGVLVRSFHGRGGRLDRCLRVTIGTEAQNTRFLETLSRVR
jgi:histidinol-phosphate aminotransferase